MNRVGFVLLILALGGVLIPAGKAQEKPAHGDDGMLLDLVEFRELPLTHALVLLSEQTGLNFVASQDAREKTVTLHLRKVKALDAIEALTQGNGLWYKKDPESGIIRIHTVEEYRRDLLSFREDKTRVFTLFFPNAVDVASAIRDLFGDRVRLSLGMDEREMTEDLYERFDRFDILDQRSQGLGLFQGSGGSFGGSQNQSLRSQNQFRSDRNIRRSDIMRDARTRQGAGREQLREFESLEGLTPEEIMEMEAALAEQAGADRSILNEILARSETTIFVTVIRRHNQVAVRTADEKSMAQIEDLIRSLDVPTPMVLLEVKILAIDLSDGFDSAFEFQFGRTNFSGGFSSGDILGSTGTAGPGDSLGLTGGGLIDGALAFQYVGNRFRTRMQLLEAENRVTALATPVLLTANNEVSRLFVGEERPLNRGFSGGQTVVGDSTVVTPGSTDIEFRPVGTTLMITPNINADRTVSLRILQEVSSISPSPASVLVPSEDGFEQQEVDLVQSRTVSGTIIAKDGLAVAFGGLIEEQLVDNETKIPILGDIPLLGFLFRQETETKLRTELVVMVRPFVFNTPVDSERISRELIEELSIHPNAPEARGTLDVYGSDDVLKAKSGKEQLLDYLRLHGFATEGEEW